MKRNNIKVFCPFPVVKMADFTMRYDKVKKIPCPGYILLTYISKGDKDRLLADNLAEAGIVGDITDIFSDALYDLIVSHKMVRCVKELSGGKGVFGQQFGKFYTRDFRLTELGEKLFKYRYATTGRSETKRITLFYDIAGRKFVRQVKEFKTDTVPADEFTSDLEAVTAEMTTDFLNSIKKELKLEEQEYVTEIEAPFKKEITFVSKEVNIEIDADGAAYFCPDSVYLDFLSSRYRSEWIDKIVRTKAGGFEYEATYPIPLQNIGAVERIICIEDKNSLKKEENMVFAGTGSLRIAGMKTVLDLSEDESSIICRTVSPICRGVSFKKNGDVQSYEMTQLEIPRKGVHGFPLRLDAILERKLDLPIAIATRNTLGEILKARAWDPECCKLAVWLSSYMGEGNSYTKDFMISHLDRAISDIERINMISTFLESVPDIDMEQLVAQIWLNVKSNVTIDNINNKLEIAVKIAKLTGNDTIPYFREIIALLPDDCEPVLLYRILLDNNISEEQALNLSRVVAHCIRMIIERKEIEGLRIPVIARSRSIAGGLWKLCDMVGIEKDPLSYSPKVIESVDTFRILLKKFASEYRAFKNDYLHYAEDEFCRLNEFYTSVVNHNHTAVEEKNVRDYDKNDFIVLADSRPEECLKQIKTRCEIELRKLLGIEDESATAFAKMLQDASNRRLIADEDFSRIDKLRIERNALDHQGKKATGDIELYKCIDSLFNIVKAAKIMKNRDSFESESSQPSSNPKSSTTGNHISKTASKGLSMIKLPHKKNYLMNKFDSDSKMAVMKLSECEFAALNALFPEKTIDNFKALGVALNDARTKRIIPEETAKSIVEFNRESKKINTNSSVTCSNVKFREWVNAVFSLTQFAPGNK